MIKINDLPFVDYYIEDGKIIFTREFLLKRGFCCNCHCRHCPYQDSLQEKIVNQKDPTSS